MLCNAFNANLSLPGLRLLSRTIECKAIQNTTQSCCLPQEASFWTPERLAQHDSCVIDASKSLYDNSNAPLASTVRRPVALPSCLLHTDLPPFRRTNTFCRSYGLLIIAEETHIKCMYAFDAMTADMAAVWARTQRHIVCRRSSIQTYAQNWLTARQRACSAGNHPDIAQAYDSKLACCLPGGTSGMVARTAAYWARMTNTTSMSDTCVSGVSEHEPSGHNQAFLNHSPRQVVAVFYDDVAYMAHARHVQQLLQFQMNRTLPVINVHQLAAVCRQIDGKRVGR